MPLTLPTHPVAVVPLKLWRPRLFALGLASLPLQPVRLMSDQAVRVMLFAALALVTGAAAVRAKAAGPRQGESRHALLPAHRRRRRHRAAARLLEGRR